VRPAFEGVERGHTQETQFGEKRGSSEGVRSGRSLKPWQELSNSRIGMPGEQSPGSKSSRGGEKRAPWIRKIRWGVGSQSSWKTQKKKNKKLNQKTSYVPHNGVNKSEAKQTPNFPWSKGVSDEPGT